MKGIVFNLLQQLVTRQGGEDAWDDVLAAVGDEGVYTSLGSYPDGEILKLLMAAAPAGSDATAALRWFGRGAMPLLAEHYPAFFSPHQSTRAFVLTLNEIIHPEVRKLYDGAQCPDFDFELAADGTLLMGYHSPRRLCALAHGFLEGAGDHYHEMVQVEHRQCMYRGDPQCLLAVGFAASVAA